MERGCAHHFGRGRGPSRTCPLQSASTEARFCAFIATYRFSPRRANGAARRRRCGQQYFRRLPRFSRSVECASEAQGTKMTRAIAFAINDPVGMAVVRAADHRLLRTGEADPARWVREQRERVEQRLSQSRSHGVVIGAFERAQLCAGCYVVGFRVRIEPNGHREVVPVWARISAEDVRSWRRKCRLACSHPRSSAFIRV
jgi:hypothetical protein